MTRAKPGLILGVGNVLLGDEGVGVHAVRRIEGTGLPPGWSALDGGTGGFHLLSCLTDFDPVILIDATLDGRPAGTVSVIEPRYASDFPRSLSAHDIGLRDLVESCALLGPLPRMTLVTVSVEDLQPMDITLSPPVEAAIPRVLEIVAERIAAPAA